MKNIIKTGLFLCAILIFLNSSGQNNYKIVKLASGNYSNPIWSPDGEKIAFTNKGQSGIMIMGKDGKNFKILSNDIGAGYKFSWSLDNEYIAYRGTRFDGNKRMQFIEVVKVSDTSKTTLVYQNGIQPPVWQYSENGKRVAYVLNNKVAFSDYYPFISSEYKSIVKIPYINTFFFYKRGSLYMINANVLNDETIRIEGMDPVISPDRKSFIYAVGDQLHLRSFDGKIDTVLGPGSHPSWSPDGLQIVYQKTTDDGHAITSADLYIMDVATMQSLRLTDTGAVFEVNPSWSPDGKSIVYEDENDGTIYLLTFN